MRKITCVVILLVKIIKSLFCGSKKKSTKAGGEASKEAKAALQGKKVLFIGNSYTMNGYAVIQRKSTVLTQQQRSNDRGFFYQLCKANGIDVSVTNWCFSGHDVTHTFGGPCSAGKECSGEDHLAYLKDRFYDYVVIQCYKEEAYTGNLATYLQPVMKLFREVNPNVKFVMLVPHMAYDRNYRWIPDVPGMKDAGFLVGNWGQMLHDVCQGNVQVPGATQKYDLASFVVSVTEKDGHHENMLAGYLTALMTYCAITGDSAVGQEYGFCDDPAIDPHFCLEVHKRLKYVYNPHSNFIDIFRSPEDMKGLQQLVDQYIAKFN